MCAMVSQKAQPSQYFSKHVFDERINPRLSMPKLTPAMVHPRWHTSNHLSQAPHRGSREPNKGPAPRRLKGSCYSQASGVPVPRCVPRSPLTSGRRMASRKAGQSAARVRGGRAYARGATADGLLAARLAFHTEPGHPCHRLPSLPPASCLSRCGTAAQATTPRSVQSSGGSKGGFGKGGGYRFGVSPHLHVKRGALRLATAQGRRINC